MIIEWILRLGIQPYCAIELHNNHRWFLIFDIFFPFLAMEFYFQTKKKQFYLIKIINNDHNSLKFIWKKKLLCKYKCFYNVNFFSGRNKIFISDNLMCGFSKILIKNFVQQNFFWKKQQVSILATLFTLGGYREFKNQKKRSLYI